MSRRETVTGRTYALVAVAAVTYTLLMFTWFSLPAYLSTISTDLGLSETQAGVVVGAVPLTYIPLGLFSGAFVDRVGPGRSLALGTVIYGGAQAGRSLATGFPSLLLLTLLLGVGATAITFGLPKLVSTLFPPGDTGLPSSIYLIAASAGTATVFGLGRPTIGPALGGWRPLFLWSGLLAIAYGVCWYGLGRLVDVDDQATDDAGSFSVASIADDLRRVLANRPLQWLVVVGTMFLLVNHGLQGWLPTILEGRGLSADRAGQTTSLFVVAYAVGIFTIPPVADRLASRQTMLSLSGLTVAAGVGGLVVGATGVLAMAGIVVTGLGAGGLSPLIRAMPPELEGVGPELTGTAVGFIFAVGEIGGFLGPVVVGSLRDATGSFLPGLVVLGAGGLVVVVAGQRLRQRS
ncbi:CynX/NimT family MFS transporter [Halobacteriales archaeon Cl-PHB]